MMHKLTIAAVLAFGLSFAGTAAISAHSQDSKHESVDKKSGETPAELIARLSKAPEGEPKEDREIRLRALQIATRELEKGTQREIEKSRSATEDRAAHEIKKEERNETKREAEVRRAYIAARISGCRSGVEVDPRAEDQTFRLLAGTSVRIMNLSHAYIDIETPARGIGVAVRNLCPGGSITLTFAKSIGESQNEQIPLSAVVRQVGVQFNAQQMYLNINSYQVQYQRIEARTWEIR